MRRAIAAFTAMSILFFAASCIDESESPKEEGVSPSFSIGAPGCQNLQPNLVANFTRTWPCYTTIRVRNGSPYSSVGTAIGTAVGRWSNAIHVSGVPYPVYVTSGEYDVTINVNSDNLPGTEFCGYTTPPTINIFLWPNANCPGNPGASHSTLANTIAHELGHALGFASFEHSVQYDGVSDHCTMHLASDLTINSTICAHEIEKVLAAYGVASLSAIQSGSFYGSHLITDLALSPGLLSLPTGQSASVSVNALLFTKQNPAGPSSLPAAGTSFSWEAAPTSVATVTQEGLVTGVSAGSAQVAARISGVSPSGTLQSGALALAGRAIPVTVIPGIWCGDPSCVPITSSYISHFTGAGCTGKESYYTPYFNNDGIRRSWNGTGRAGTTLRTVTNKSTKASNGVCTTQWPNGNTLPGFVTVYRAVCGEASCQLITGSATSEYPALNCVSQEYSTSQSGRGTWDAAGIAGTAITNNLSVYSGRSTNGQCSNYTGFTRVVSNVVKVYR
jgi:hypothetical protein